MADALDALADESREVMLLYYREGKSTAQVATLLGLQVTTVKQRMTRARAALRLEAATRFGEAVERTAPPPGFAASVMSALPLAAPGSGVGAAKLGLFAGAMAGVGAGMLGALAGAHLQARQATTSAERSAVWQLGFMNVLGVVGFGLCIAVAQHAWVAVIAYCSLVALLGYTTQIALERVIAGRLALERAHDPRVVARQRRRRLLRFVSFAAGAVCGGAGLLAGLLAR